jgi:hypothetical protein
MAPAANLQYIGDRVEDCAAPIMDFIIGFIALDICKILVSVYFVYIDRNSLGSIHNIYIVGVIALAFIEMLLCAFLFRRVTKTMLALDEVSSV